MIPKTIHYCWFGRNEKPEQVQKCIESWYKFLPDYEFREWNEDNFDVSCCNFTEQAAEAKKWAFISDYVRAWALNTYGGIYFDTDVIVHQSFDIFLSHIAFTGFESIYYPCTAVWGSIKKHELTKQLLSIYNKKSFIRPDGKYEMVPNNKLIAKLISEYGINLDYDGLQFGVEGLVIYPSYVFCLDLDSALHYSTHLFLGSWVNENEKKVEMQKNLLQKYFLISKNIRYEKVANLYTVTAKKNKFKSFLKKVYFWLKRKFPHLFE
jgi:hypothetical protein